MEKFNSNNFIPVKYLNFTVRYSVGFFEIYDKITYAFCYGYPNKNDDYYSFTQINKDEFLNLIKIETLSQQDALNIDKTHKKICDEFPNSKNKSFTKNDINKYKNEILSYKYKNDKYTFFIILNDNECYNYLFIYKNIYGEVTFNHENKEFMLKIKNNVKNFTFNKNIYNDIFKHEEYIDLLYKNIKETLAF